MPLHYLQLCLELTHSPTKPHLLTLCTAKLGVEQQHLLAVLANLPPRAESLVGASCLEASELSAKTVVQ